MVLTPGIHVTPGLFMYLAQFLVPAEYSVNVGTKETKLTGPIFWHVSGLLRIFYSLSRTKSHLKKPKLIILINPAENTKVE